MSRCRTARHACDHVLTPVSCVRVSARTAEWESGDGRSLYDVPIAVSIRSRHRPRPTAEASTQRSRPGSHTQQTNTNRSRCALARRPPIAVRSRRVERARSPLPARLTTSTTAMHTRTSPTHTLSSPRRWERSGPSATHTRSHAPTVPSTSRRAPPAEGGKTRVAIPTSVRSLARAHRLQGGTVPPPPRKPRHARPARPTSAKRAALAWAHLAAQMARPAHAPSPLRLQEGHARHKAA